MTDYIKIPTFPTQDLLRGIEALSPYPRIDPQSPRQDGYSRQQSDSAADRDKRVRRRFLALRRLINALKKSAKITRVDYATADAELHALGLAMVAEQLPAQLLQLKIPLQSIEQLLPQIDRERAAVSLGSGRRIQRAGATLVGVSAEGLSEYNLKIENLAIGSGGFDRKLSDPIDQEGLYIIEQNRLRLTFSRLGPDLAATGERLNLTLIVLLGVIETDQAGRRAILYQRADKNYGLYADKQINLSI